MLPMPRHDTTRDTRQPQQKSLQRHNISFSFSPFAATPPLPPLFPYHILSFDESVSMQREDGRTVRLCVLVRSVFTLFWGNNLLHDCSYWQGRIFTLQEEMTRDGCAVRYGKDMSFGITSPQTLRLETDRFGIGIGFGIGFGYGDVM